MWGQYIWSRQPFKVKSWRVRFASQDLHWTDCSWYEKS